jgi:hypothetical protein
VYAYRGESDKSFEWLELAYEPRDPGLPKFNSDPLFNNLLHDPRYPNLSQENAPADLEQLIVPRNAVKVGREARVE